MEKYYQVKAKCGHVRKNRFICIDFAIRANSKKIAAELIRKMPRVKHDHKDAILSVDEITLSQFLALKVQNASDPYLQCSNVQEQKKIEDLYKRIQNEPEKKDFKKDRNIFFKKLKEKIAINEANSLIYNSEII